MDNAELEDTSIRRGIPTDNTATVISNVLKRPYDNGVNEPHSAIPTKKRSDGGTDVSPKPSSTDNPIPSVVQECATSSSTASFSSPKIVEEAVVDITKDINLLPGARVEVRWDVHHEDLINSKVVLRSHTRWWGASLMPHDGRHHVLKEERNEGGDVMDKVTVPLRVLNYDPFPSGGFDKCSLECVCFLTDHLVLNIDSSEQAYWRKEGDSWNPPVNMEEKNETLVTNPLSAISAVDDDDISVESSSREGALRVILDTVLKTALSKSGVMTKMNNLPASQRCHVAEKIASAKEKLTQKLMEQLRCDDGISLASVITPKHLLSYTST